MDRKALIFGVTGQDGAYLSRLLLERQYEVHGTSRSASNSRSSLQRLGVEQSICPSYLDPTDSAAVSQTIDAVRPDEIYYLAAQSSVARSFAAPAETFQGIAIGVLNVLAAAKAIVPQARIFNAASGDCFGETSSDSPATEQSRFAPRSPYAAAKCAAHHLIEVARLAGRQFACSGFLFNHESPLRSEQFAIGKIIAAVRRIRSGSPERLEVGNIGVVRDWGWAPDYVDAMWRMLQQPHPRDFVIATGRSHRLQDFIEEAFSQAGLDWRDHVEVEASPARPADIVVHHADPSLAQELLGWSASKTLLDMPAALLGDEPH